jgi:hypothetical protein
VRTGVAGSRHPCDDLRNVERQTCADCGKDSPETETNYTLISAQFGWRLTRAYTDDGLVIEWRCPECWREHKLKRGTVTGGGTEDRRSVPPPPGNARASTPPPRAAPVPKIGSPAEKPPTRRR